MSSQQKTARLSTAVLTDLAVPSRTKRQRHLVVKQASQACVACARVKMRCERIPLEPACRRCSVQGIACEWRESKRGKWNRRRKNESPHLDGLASTRDASTTPSLSSHRPSQQVTGDEGHNVAEELSDNEDAMMPLPHLETPAEEPRDFGGAVHFKVDSSLFPLGLLAESSLIMRADPDDGHRVTTAPQAPDEDFSPRTGPANPAYFRQGLNAQFRPSPSKREQPKILDNEFVTPAEAELLFDIFFNKCNPQIGLLDRGLCSISTCAKRSPFLFTTICAVAARYYKGGALYPPLMRAARSSGLEAMLEAKTTYTVQGFIILAYWGPPTTAYELDNSWLFAGIAIRLGHEIGIHHKNFIRFPENTPMKARLHYQAEMINRERTWFCCFLLDRACGALSGKPETIYEKFLIRSANVWYDQPGTTVSDVWLSAITEMLRIVFRILDVVYSSSTTKSAISSDIDYVVVADDLTQRLDDWLSIWEQRLINKETSVPNDHTRIYRAQLKAYKAFYKLVPLSIGLQNSAEKNPHDVDSISFTYPCYQCAVDVLDVAHNDLGSSWLKYSTDHWIVILAYCACFLLKLLNTRFSRLFDRETILQYANQTASLLEKAAEDEEHSPFVYAAFIRKRLAYEQTAPMQHQRQSIEPPTFAPNQQEHLNIFGPPMMGRYAMPSAPDVSDPLASLNNDPQTEVWSSRQVDALLQTDWIDTFLSQQNQGHYLDIAPLSMDNERRL